jgi:hypothetical protein
MYESGMWTESPQAFIRSLVDLEKLNEFYQAALAAKSARFEHGETP